MGSALLVVLTGWLYAPVLHAGYVYEDHNDARVFLRGWSAWVHEDLYGRDPQQPAPTFSLRQLLRPRLIPSALAAATHSLSPDAARGDHLVSLGLHLLNVALFAWIAWSLFGPFGAACAAVVFAVHPLQSEAVAYVSARPDICLATGCLLALIGVRARSRSLTLLGVLLALLSKETGVMVGLLAASAWALMYGVRRAHLVGIALGGLAALVITATALPPLHGFAQRPLLVWRDALSLLNEHTFIVATEQLAQVWRLLAFVVWPMGLSIVHAWDWITPSAGFVALVGFALLLWAARQSRAAQWLAAAILLLLPRLLLNDHQPLHEHHLYASMIGVSLSLGELADRVRA